MNPIRMAFATLLFTCALAAQAAPRQVVLTVPSMDCDTCPITIKAALMKVPGVKRAVVSYQKRTAVATFDDTSTNVAALTRATDGAGYPSFQADAK